MFYPMGLFPPSEPAQSRNQKYRSPLQHILGVTLHPTGERRGKGHPTETATHSRRQRSGVSPRVSTRTRIDPKDPLQMHLGVQALWFSLQTSKPIES